MKRDEVNQLGFILRNSARPHSCNFKLFDIKLIALPAKARHIVSLSLNNHILIASHRSFVVERITVMSVCICV
jgi:hypothetical protein